MSRTETGSKKSVKPVAQKKPSKKARAISARLAAVQAVYQMILNKQTPDSLIREFVGHRLGKAIDDTEMVQPDSVLFTNIIRGVCDRRNDLEDMIQRILDRRKGEPSSRKVAADEGDEISCDTPLISVEPLLMATLLCGGYEILAHHEIDAPIIIADYLNITHSFYEKNESALVNAVLDKMKVNIRDSG